MPANMPAINQTGVAVPHVEFAMERADLQQFALSLIADLLANPAATVFHLQIQATGVAPGVGAPQPIAPTAGATVTIHQFPLRAA